MLMIRQLPVWGSIKGEGWQWNSTYTCPHVHFRALFPTQFLRDQYVQVQILFYSTSPEKTPSVSCKVKQQILTTWSESGLRIWVLPDSHTYFCSLNLCFCLLRKGERDHLSVCSFSKCQQPGLGLTQVRSLELWISHLGGRYLSHQLAPPGMHSQKAVSEE